MIWTVPIRVMARMAYELVIYGGGVVVVLGAALLASAAIRQATQDREVREHQRRMAALTPPRHPHAGARTNGAEPRRRPYDWATDGE